MPPIAYTSVPRCYSVTLACSFIGCSISGSETYPSSRPAVQFVATDTFFSKFTCTSTSTVWVGAARGLSVCVATVAVRTTRSSWSRHAYVPPVRRCTTCNKLGHLKAQCRCTVPVCPRCGRRGHTPDVCPIKLCCLKCGGPHSAAYQGCPQQRLRLIANRIRSGTFIPYSEALKRAHVEVEDRKKPLQPIAETAPAVSKTFEPPKRSYADHAAGNKVQTCVPAVTTTTTKKPPYWPLGP